MKITNNQKGFTLLETLIAIFILTLAITGPIYISSFALRNTIDSRDNISAQYLAEEVIEVIRNRRDQRMLNNMKTPTNWLFDTNGSITKGVDGVVANCFNTSLGITNKCSMTRDVDGNYGFESCSGPGGNCSPLSFASSSHIIYGSKEELLSTSKFTREFYFQSNSPTVDKPNQEIKLIVNIKWKERGRDRVYSLQERLSNINYVDFFSK